MYMQLITGRNSFPSVVRIGRGDYAPYVIDKWLHVYHYFSSYRRKTEVFSSVCFIAVCEILHSSEKKSAHLLKIPCILVWFMAMDMFAFPE